MSQPRCPLAASPVVGLQAEDGGRLLVVLLVVLLVAPQPVSSSSHPGIEKIIESATTIEPKLYSVFGGFHLVDIPDSKVSEMVYSFRDKWKIERMAAGHCTGQFAFAELIRVFGNRFDPAGVGSVISLPT